MYDEGEEEDGLEEGLEVRWGGRWGDWICEGEREEELDV